MKYIAGCSVSIVHKYSMVSWEKIVRERARTDFIVVRYISLHLNVFYVK